MDNEEYRYTDFEYGAECEDVDEYFIHKESILSSLPFELQLDFDCFNKTFCNLYHYYKNNEEHHAHLLDDLFYEEFVLASTEKAFKHNNHKQIINEIKDTVNLIE